MTKLNQELKRSPTETEIVGELGLGIRAYHGFLDQLLACSGALACDTRGDQWRGGLECSALVADFAVVEPQFTWIWWICVINSSRRRRSARGLETVAATFYFYEGITLKEIGKALELSEGCISQILRYAFTDLREHLEWSLLELNESGAVARS